MWNIIFIQEKSVGIPCEMAISCCARVKAGAICIMTSHSQLHLYSNENYTSNRMIYARHFVLLF